MKHLSETPLPENFPANVRIGLGNVAYDKELISKPFPEVAVTSTPSPAAKATAVTIPKKSPTIDRNSKGLKTITCEKNGRTIKVTGRNPKCPSGYTIKE
jgi:hypothetical protein